MEASERRHYDKVHQWLKRNFPHSNKCEMPGCTTHGLRIEWALLKGKTYEKLRENFWELCASCHRKYDWTKEQSEKITQALRERVYSSATRRKMSLSRVGVKLGVVAKEKIAEKARERWRRWKERGFSPIKRDEKTGRLLPKV